MSGPIDELRRVRSLQANNWGDLRDPSTHRLVEVELPFGKRLAYEATDQGRYEDLQSSRGIASADTVEEIIRTQSLDLTEVDTMRVTEVARYVTLKPGSVFYEIGFRYPRLLDYYHKAWGMTVLGCDVSALNVEVGKVLGFNVEKVDLNHQTPDLRNTNLVVAYHVLEHMTRPHEAIQRIFDSLPVGSYGHFEIPIEPGTPRIRYAHMFAFEYGDLPKMCQMAGFNVLAQCSVPYAGGPEIERVFVRKG